MGIMVIVNDGYYILWSRILTQDDDGVVIVSYKVQDDDFGGGDVFICQGLLFAYALLTDSLSALISSSSSRSSSSSSPFSRSQNLFDILTSVVLPAVERDEDW